MKWQARAFLAVMAVAGVAVLGYGLMNVRSGDWLRFASLLAVGVVASVLKVRLPKLTGCLSVSVPFLLIAAAELSLFEAVILASACGVAQSWFGSQQRPRFVHVLFNWSDMTLATAVAFAIFHPRWWTTVRPVSFGIAGLAFLLINSAAVASIIRLTEGGSIRRIWWSIFLWAFPNHVGGAGMALMFTAAVKYVGWHVPLLLFPVMLIVYRSYRLFCARVETVATAEQAKAAAS